MKKILGFIVLLSVLSSCTNNDNVTITGSYPAGKGEYLQLEMLNIDQVQFIDSVKIKKNGNFRFSFRLDNPEIVLIKNRRAEMINLLSFPEDNIDLEIKDTLFSSGYNVTGSAESEKIRTLVENLEQTRFQLDSISTALDQLENREGPEAAVLNSSFQQIYQKQKRNNIRFVVENINSLSSVYALYQRIAPDVYIFSGVRDLQYFKIVADSLKVTYPESTLTISLVNDVNKRISEYNNTLLLNELSKTEIMETGLIDLKIEDPNREIISLKSLKGKVVLLNFWASWDQGSRDATRALKGIYNQYHSRGFEIYSVALENDRNRWRTVIDFEEFQWINVSELTYPNSYAATVYNVTTIPSNYLIDREGNIVSRNITGKVLSTWLDNLL